MKRTPKPAMAIRNSDIRKAHTKWFELALVVLVIAVCTVVIN